MTIIIIFRFVIGTEIALASISTPLTIEFKFCKKVTKKLALNFHFKIQSSEIEKASKASEENTF